MNNLLLSVAVSCLFVGCTLYEFPPDDLIPTSGAGVLPEVKAGDLDEAWTRFSGEAVPDQLPLRPLEKGEMGGDLGISGVFPDYNRGNVSPSTRIFLVAGSAADGTDLEHLVLERDYWLVQGYSEDQIACYFVKPYKADYEENRARFDALAARTEGFYLAAPHVLFKHLRELSAHDPRSVYLHVTAEGKEPLRGSGEKAALASRYPDFADSYRLVLRGGPSGHMNERMRLEALRDGIDAHYLLFTDKFLGEALSMLPDSCEKFVVLAGDHADGFVTSPDGKGGALRSVPAITVLASSRHDRKTWRPANGRGGFGGIYLDALAVRTGTVEARSWNELASAVMASVERGETLARIPQKDRSRPMFHSTLDRESGPVAEVSVPAEVESGAQRRKPAFILPGSVR